MNRISVDLFTEDRAHQEFIKNMLYRLASDLEILVVINDRVARGGHGRVMDELFCYQALMREGTLGTDIPDLLVVAIDANCTPFNRARQEIHDRIEQPFTDRAVIACPDPHIERWYLADPDSFFRVVGVRPQPGRKKCKRDWYKNILSRAVVDAGHPATLGGIEFAREIVGAMNLYQGGKADSSLKHFLDDTEAALKRFSSPDMT